MNFRGDNLYSRVRRKEQKHVQRNTCYSGFGHYICSTIYTLIALQKVTVQTPMLVDPLQKSFYFKQDSFHPCSCSQELLVPSQEQLEQLMPPACSEGSTRC